MRKYVTIIILGILLIASSGIINTSCKTPGAPKAVVYVIEVKENNVAWPVNMAEVKLDPPDGASQPDLIEYTQKPKLTDPNGKVTYDFKYEGIIKVVAQKYEGSILKCGQGVLILKEGETVQETVRLSECYE
jgi:hypothetical protein